MEITLYTWFDELNNECDRYFLNESGCDVDVEEWRRYGYKRIGKCIQYSTHRLHLPKHEKLLYYLTAWCMNNRLKDSTTQDLLDISELYLLLGKLFGMVESVDTIHLKEFIQTLSETKINIMLNEIDCYFAYLYDFFIDCLEMYDSQRNITCA